MLRSAVFRTVSVVAGLGSAALPAHSCGGQTHSPPPVVRLPLEIRRGDLMIQARVNGSKPLSFKLDTGFTVTTIRPDHAETLELKRLGSLTIVGIAGEEEAATFTGVEFDFGGATYSPRRVAALPSQGGRRGRSRDGLLGEGFFRRFVVAVDATNRTVQLYEPKLFNYTGAGEVVPLEFKDGTPVLEATLDFANRPSLSARFEIDTGCDDYLCVGRHFVAEHRLADQADKGDEDFRQGVGGNVKIRRGQLRKLKFGQVAIDQPFANFFIEGSPVDKELAGHIGLGALLRFKIIFDYSRQQMILEPSP